MNIAWSFTRVKKKASSCPTYLGRTPLQMKLHMRQEEKKALREEREGLWEEEEEEECEDEDRLQAVASSV